MFTTALNSQVIRARFLLRRRRADVLRARMMKRPFSPAAQSRLLLVSQPERIPQSQIFAFHHFANDLHRLYGTEVREADLGAVLSGKPVAAAGATAVAFQTPFDISDIDLQRLVGRLRADHPGAQVGCLDWFAPTDLRNAARMNPLVDFYVKKHLLRDRTRYGRPTQGDTNLTDHYSRRFNLPKPERRFDIPPGFLDKLILGPTFATAPMILPELLGAPPQATGRIIDLHARFAVEGTPWYRAMRAEAEAALDDCTGLRMLRGGGVPQSQFIAELRMSKVCFSPFGYGEVCWRDYEAVAGGAILLKPDMGHIETDPDIFVPWETYVPLAWDLSDLNDTLERLLSDKALRARIARTAFDTLRDWLRSDTFARRMAPVLKAPR